MKKIDVLIKALFLLYRENIGKDINSDSKDLVKNILKTMTENKNVLGGEQLIITDFKNLLKDMMSNPDNYNDETILQTLSIILKDKQSLYSAVEKGITAEFTNPGLKRSIISLRNILNNYYKEEEIKNIISSASYKINTGQIGDLSIKDFVQGVVTNLEAHLVKTKTSDPAIIDEIDIGDESTMSETLEKVKTQVNGSGKFITGWKELNIMLQGGLRRSEMVMINALPHNYKSGFTRSLFMQLAMHNKPIMNDETKKPMMLYISFEDDADITIDFMYKYLYYNENNELPDLSVTTSQDMAKYIKEKLTVNGYYIKILRVNPSEWTFKDIFNKILEYEANGFELHAVFLDYLAKISTAGCISGPAGADYKDLFNRIRNFFTAKNILIVTPHQLSTEAKQLIRQGEPAINFVKTVKSKGYFDHSRALDQIVDLEIYLHKAFINRKPVLTVGRGKHRIPSIIDEEYQYFILPFPKDAPIKENLHEKSDVEEAFQKENEDELF